MLVISNLVYVIMQYKNVWKLYMMRNVTNVGYEFLIFDGMMVWMNDKMGNWKCIV